jgi:rubrerythrin
MEPSESRLADRLQDLIKKLERLREAIQSAALDEESEATAYSTMALACQDEDLRWKLFIIAMDSILHREIAWAIARASYEAEKLAKELSMRTGEKPLKAIVDELKPHAAIENLAESIYKDLLQYAEPGTTLYRLLQLLAEEEGKHRQLVANILQKVKGQE